MSQFNFVGGEFIDARIPESFVTFSYSLFASNRTEAVEKFAIIFPSCVMVSVE